MADKGKIVSLGIVNKNEANQENPLSFRLSLDINWHELIEQATLLEESVKSLADGFEKASVVLEEKRPGQVVGIDDEKAIRAYRAMIEHYRNIEQGATEARGNLEKAKKKYG